jgi:hypothetical protein
VCNGHISEEIKRVLWVCNGHISEEIKGVLWVCNGRPFNTYFGTSYLDDSFFYTSSCEKKERRECIIYLAHI